MTATGEAKGEAKGFLHSVGAAVSREFAESRTILSFEEYLALFVQAPTHQARNAAQYLRATMDHFGTEEVPHPTGPIRRFKLFDQTEADREGRVAGQEEVQNAIYRLLGNFVRAGRINKLILLHGPNGSAKSSIVDALKRGLEGYSRTTEGALYRINWVFPSDKLVKGSIGFGERPGTTSAEHDLGSYAHLDLEHVDVRVSCELKDHPLLVIPRDERIRLLSESLPAAGKGPDFILSDYLLNGGLCHKCGKIYAALLSSYKGDYLKVLRHVQVERFYLSRLYQVGAVSVEPQMSVDASYHQVSADRSQSNLPAALQNLVLFDAGGPLVSGNRGIIEYADLLKRPLEAYKYLLGFSETGEVPMEHFLLQLDELLIASSNEKHLNAFKELPDFASFKGRIELVRVPYLRRYRVEQQIYDAQTTPTAVGKHVAPHATRTAALWVTLTRLKKPVLDRYSTESRELVDSITPLEKAHLYEEGAAPDRMSLAQSKELKKQLALMYEESDNYPNYEGRIGGSAREIKTALFNAAQATRYKCLSPMAVLDELESICRDKTVYEFLQQEVVDGYHDPAEFVKKVRGELVDWIDVEVRDSMGLVSEAQYRDLFDKYLQNISHWVKGEKIRNRITGESERPDERRMGEMEVIFMPKGEDPGEFRRALITQIGAHSLDNPDVALDYARIFPDLFRRLREHFFEERKRILQRNEENVLKYLSDDRASLSAKERIQVEDTLKTMAQRYGYCESCAKDALLFVMRERYAR